MKKNVWRKIWLLILLIVVITALYVVWALERPIPLLRPILKSSELNLSTPDAIVTWPVLGQSAMGILNSNILKTNQPQKQMPTASTAKVITALTVLQDKPLTLGQRGPMLALNNSDVALYDSYLAQGGSVVPVNSGESISEYQVLEAMLLPSANNLADSLAIWAYGSLPAYKVAAVNYLKSHGIDNTTIGPDASGYDPSSTSTASDLVKIGELAMQNSVITQIISQHTATDIPNTNQVKNVNFLLGTDGIVGVKTGNTSQAGGVYISSSVFNIAKKPITIVTAVMNSPSLFQALKDTLPIIQSTKANFKPYLLLPAKSIVGHYKAPNGTLLPIKTKQDLTITSWNGQVYTGRINIDSLSSDSKAGKIVGKITTTDKLTSQTKSVSLYLAKKSVKPTIWQRIFDPMN